MGNVWHILVHGIEEWRPPLIPCPCPHCISPGWWRLWTCACPVCYGACLNQGAAHRAHPDLAWHTTLMEQEKRDPILYRRFYFKF
jgi:hypothetical protein